MIVLAVLSAAVSVGVAALVKAALYRAGPPAPRVVNLRGVEVPAVGGLVIAMSFIAYEAVLGLLTALAPAPSGIDPSFSPAAMRQTFYSFDHLGLFIVVLGFFLLGAIDDHVGSGSDKGLKGHARALMSGRLTTGGLKALGGLAIGWICGVLWEGEVLEAAVAGLVVALVANFINLLDLAPGRAVKGSLIVMVPLTIVSFGSPLMPLSVALIGSTIVWLPTDLSERGMLGDAGANLLGGVAGAGLVLTTGMPGKLVALCILIVLTLASEKVSFSAVIAKTPILRELDRLGRVRE